MSHSSPQVFPSLITAPAAFGEVGAARGEQSWPQRVVVPALQLRHPRPSLSRCAPGQAAGPRTLFSVLSGSVLSPPKLWTQGMAHSHVRKTIRELLDWGKMGTQAGSEISVCVLSRTGAGLELHQMAGCAGGLSASQRHNGRGTT